MDLAQLKFVVDTSELKSAASEIDKLAVAVDKLNKPLHEVTTASKELNKEQQVTEKTTVKSTESTKKQTSVLERQQMILQFMTEGYSKGQASQLAYAKAAGALSDDLQTLGTVLQTQRKLMGTDPFDKSMGALQALRNEYTVTKEVQRLYNAGLGLSKSQMEDLAKEKLRLIERLKLEGATLTDVKNGLMELNAAYIRNASAENNIVKNMKDKQRAVADASKANEYIIKELDRVNRLTQDNGNITSATNNALIRFEKALKPSGMSAGEQVTKLEAYKQSLLSIQKASGQRQVDYLSRALGPQITDIFVGLATGQSPMMVLLQQGGQLRDQFALAGVAGKDMANMLITAAQSMISSIKDIGVAVGQLLVKAFVGVGEAIATSLLAPFKQMSVVMGGLTNGTMTFSEAAKGLGTSFVALAKTGVIAVVLALAALAIEYVKITQANTALSQAISLTGASLGMTRDEAVGFAETLSSKTGSSTLKYIGILTEFAKAGAKVDEEIILLASDLDKYLGQGIDKTAQQLNDLGNEPTKALVKIAKEQGFVTEKTLAQVYAYEQVGNKTAAAELATKAYTASQRNAVVEAKKNLDPLQVFWISIKDSISSAMNEIYNFAKTPQIIEGAKVAFEVIKTVLGAVWTVVKQVVGGIGGLFSSLSLASQGKFSEAFDALKESISTFVGASVQGDDQQQKSAKVASDAAAKQKQANSIAASSFEERMKKQKEASDFYAGIMKEINKIEAESTASTNQLNNAQKKSIDLISDPKFNALPRQKQIEALTRLANASAAIEEVKELESFNKIMKDVIAIQIDAISAGNELNKVEKERPRLASDPTYLKMSDAKKAEIQTSLDVAKVVLDEVNVEKDLRKAIEESNKAYVDKQRTSYELGVISKQASIDSIKALIIEGETLDYQSSILSKTERERNKLLKVRQVELELQKEILALDKQVGLSAVDRESLKADAATRAAIKIANANKSINYEDDLARVQAYGSAFQNVFTGMADAIVDFAKTGKLNFSDLINNMIMDIARFELRKQSLAMYEGFGGSSGILKSLGSMFVTQAKGGAWSDGVQKFANGGTFTNSIVDSPTLFKFAKGTGLMGEAGPEAIMPLRRGADGSLGVQASGSGSNVSVQVINNSNAEATTNETVDSRGNRKIEVVIGEMAAGQISRSGSASQKSISSTFGIQPKLIRR